MKFNRCLLIITILIAGSPLTLVAQSNCSSITGASNFNSAASQSCNSNSQSAYDRHV